MSRPLFFVSPSLYNHLALIRKVSSAKDGQRLDVGESTHHDF